MVFSLRCWNLSFFSRICVPSIRAVEAESKVSLLMRKLQHSMDLQVPLPLADQMHAPSQASACPGWRM